MAKTSTDGTMPTLPKSTGMPKRIPPKTKGSNTPASSTHGKKRNQNIDTGNSSGY